MKIGLSVTPFFSIDRKFKNFDGIGTYTYELYKALAQENIEINEIYFKSFKEILTENIHSEKNFIVAKNRLQAFCLGSYYDLASLKIDLLHITDYLIPRVKKIPVVSTIHDAIMLQHNPEWSKRNRCAGYLKKIILKQMNCRVDGIITVSRSALNDLINYWEIPEHKVSVVYSGISADWYSKIDTAVKDSILKKYQLTKPFFLTVGTLQPRKNLERMIKAYHSLPRHIRDNFSLVVVGKQHPGMTPVSLVNLLENLSQNKNEIIWLKYVPNLDLRALYQSSYALLYPSLAEGFGLPILEGFASEIPVITSNFGSMAEIGHPAAYLVDPYSIEAIRSAMGELIEKSQLRSELIQKGLKQVQQFTWDACAKNTMDVYKKFL